MANTRIITLIDQKTGYTQSIETNVTVLGIFNILHKHAQKDPKFKYEFAATLEKEK